METTTSITATICANCRTLSPSDYLSCKSCGASFDLPVHLWGTANQGGQTACGINYHAHDIDGRSFVSHGVTCPDCLSRGEGGDPGYARPQQQANSASENQQGPAQAAPTGYEQAATQCADYAAHQYEQMDESLGKAELSADAWEQARRAAMDSLTAHHDFDRAAHAALAAYIATATGAGHDVVGAQAAFAESEASVAAIRASAEAADYQDWRRTTRRWQAQEEQQQQAGPTTVGRIIRTVCIDCRLETEMHTDACIRCYSDHLRHPYTTDTQPAPRRQPQEEQQNQQGAACSSPEDVRKEGLAHQAKVIRAAMAADDGCAYDDYSDFDAPIAFRVASLGVWEVSHPTMPHPLGTITRMKSRYVIKDALARPLTTVRTLAEAKEFCIARW